MTRDRLRAIVDALLVFLSVGLLGLVMFWVYNVLDWPGWIRFVNALPLPGKLKMWLWGWF